MDHDLSHIAALLCDVDGSLASPQLWYGGASEGSAEALKPFHVRDGHRMVMARAYGLRVGLCSGRDSAPLRRRAADLRLDPVLLGVGDKLPALRQWCQEVGISLSQVCFIGDDYPDLPLLGQVGCMVAPADAAPVLRRRADRVTRAPAGGGAVAEVVEWLLRAQGHWPPGGH